MSVDKFLVSNPPRLVKKHPALHVNCKAGLLFSFSTPGECTTLVSVDIHVVSMSIFVHDYQHVGFISVFLKIIDKRYFGPTFGNVGLLNFSISVMRKSSTISKYGFILSKSSCPVHFITTSVGIPKKIAFTINVLLPQ